jgi:integral membrane sensor domain MASE1
MLNLVSQYPMSPAQSQASHFRRMVIQRVLLENAIAFLLQYIGLMLHLLSPAPLPLWFDTGTACAYVFMRGYTVLPGIFLATIFAYYSANADLVIMFFCAALLTLQPLSLLYISRYYIYPGLLFYSRRILALFLGCSAIITCIFSGLLVLVSYKDITTSLSLTQLWLQWWLADWNGLLIFACALVTWDAYFPSVHALQKISRSRLALILTAIVLTSIALVLNHDFIFSMILAVISFILSGAMAIKYGKCGGITTVFIIGLIVGLSAFLGAPIFSGQKSWEMITFFQLLLLIQTINALSMKS